MTPFPFALVIATCISLMPWKVLFFSSPSPMWSPHAVFMVSKIQISLVLPWKVTRFLFCCSYLHKSSRWFVRLVVWRMSYFETNVIFPSEFTPENGSKFIHCHKLTSLRKQRDQGQEMQILPHCPCQPCRGHRAWEAAENSAPLPSLCVNIISDRCAKNETRYCNECRHISGPHLLINPYLLVLCWVFEMRRMIKM